jgi:triosephosphate isomerase
LKKFVVAANWKMYKSPAEAVTYWREFLPSLGKELPGNREIVFFVPTVDLTSAQTELHSSFVKWGAQNCHFELKGAFTGELSPAVLAEIGAHYCLVGHSERRALFHESDQEVGKKVKSIQDVGLIPMLCVGETLIEREQGETADVISRQLRAGLEVANLSKPITVAYEPVWAIGTGRVATPEQANEAHKVLREMLREIGGETFALNTSILYGGSVKPENSVEIGAMPEIDGFLVGGASLEPKSFAALCQTQVKTVA